MADKQSHEASMDANEKITVLEALASELVPTGPNMSNRSTPTAADADDQ
jgi:hypothetical protein